MLSIRPARDSDRPAIWDMLEPVIRAGETYTLPRDLEGEAALAFWFAPGHEVFVAEDSSEILGTYFLRPNQQGGGSHVANCGYVTALRASGRGIASAMCTHSLEHARSRSFLAMQFNFVVSTNTRAAELWLRHGFEVVGTVPKAFRHPRLGFVDALIFFRPL